MRTMRRIWKKRRPRRADVAKTWPPLPSEITTTLATIVTTSSANRIQRQDGLSTSIATTTTSTSANDDVMYSRKEIDDVVDVVGSFTNGPNSPQRQQTFLSLFDLIAQCINKTFSRPKRRRFNCKHKRVYSVKLLWQRPPRRRCYSACVYLFGLCVVAAKFGTHAKSFPTCTDPRTHRSRRKAAVKTSNGRGIPGSANGNRTTIAYRNRNVNV